MNNLKKNFKCFNHNYCLPLCLFRGADVTQVTRKLFSVLNNVTKYLLISNEFWVSGIV